MRVATWNVLHRIHAVNWHEPIVDLHPDEATRVTAISARIAELGADVVCLQEVSGDQLASLRAAFPNATVLEHTYPRVPKLFRPGPPPLVDPTEHLVTISLLPVRTSHGRTFPTDQGKGYLVSELESGAVVINTHVSFGEHHGAQCAQLGAEARAYDGPSVIVGDFNKDRDLLAFGSEFTAAIPAGPRPTRPRTQPSGKSETIDHVVVYGGTVDSATVEDGRALSDHNPVIATVQGSQNMRRAKPNSP